MTERRVLIAASSFGLVGRGFRGRRDRGRVAPYVLLPRLNPCSLLNFWATASPAARPSLSIGSSLSRKAMSLPPPVPGEVWVGPAPWPVEPEAGPPLRPAAVASAARVGAAAGGGGPGGGALGRGGGGGAGWVGGAAATGVGGAAGPMGVGGELTVKGVAGVGGPPGACPLAVGAAVGGRTLPGAVGVSTCRRVGIE